jgi:hypothetical protein
MKLSNIYKPNDNFYIILTKNFIWGALGILFGITINNSVVFISTLFEIKILLLQILIQLILCSFILALINTLFNYFAWTWQNITPGLFFVSFFFGVQFTMFKHIQNTYINNT